MNRKLCILSLTALTAVASVSAKSYKRGVSENSFALGCQVETLMPGVSWYYTWGSTPPRGVDDGIENLGAEFVPMCWNGNFDTEKIREYLQSHPNTKYILGFNEPNFTKQANMTPAEAAEKWPEIQALASEFGLKIVAPALNYSPNPPYTDPLRWMDEFVALVGKDAFDFVAIHNYGGLGVMQDLSKKFWGRYGKPVWVTEFCFWPGESGYVAPATQINSMIESVEWLEKTDYIYRYAWFKPIGQSNGSTTPNYGLLQTQTSMTESFLSEQGKVYVHMSDFDPERYHTPEEVVPATDYTNRFAATIGEGNNTGCPVPIEITSFIAGAWLDYQFDVPSEGSYFVVLNVSGKGEPERFDPKLAVYEVDAEGNQGSCLMNPATFTLTNDDNIYKYIWLPVSLTAGRQTIRVADANPYAPSGMRISTVRLVKGGAGVEAVENAAPATADVYSIDGVCVRREADLSNPLEGLPSGLYIVNGLKILK